MNLPSQIIRFSIAFVTLVALVPEASFGQDSDVNFHEEPRITQGLLTRSELNRLLKRTPQVDRNPLRKIRAFPKPIIKDSAVTQTAWQEEPATSASGFVVNQQTKVTSNADIPKVDKITAPPVPEKVQSEPDQPTPTEVSDNQSDVAPDAPIMLGPEPSPEMMLRWREFDLLTAGSLDEIEIEISNKSEELKSPVGTDEAKLEQRRKLLNSANEAVNEAKQNIEKKLDFQNQISDFPSEIELLRQNARLPIDPRPADTSIPITEMQTTLKQLQAELDHSNSQSLKLQELIQNRDLRMGLIPTEMIQLRDQANAIHEEILKKQAEGSDDFLSILALRAKEHAANSGFQLREKEASWHEISQEELPLKKSVHQRKAQRLELEIKDWNQAIARTRKAELDKQIRIAKQKAIDADPSLRELSEKTTTVAETRKELAEKIAAIENEKLKVSQLLGKVDEQHQSLKQSLAEVGQEDSRTLLIEIHRNLTRPFEGMARIRKLKNERQQIKSAIRQLRNEQEQFNDPRTYISDVLKIRVDAIVEPTGTTLGAMAEESIVIHRKQLNKLIKDSENYNNLLNEVLPQRENLLKKINSTRELVDKHTLWVQSADAVGLDVLQKSRDGAVEFFDPSEWKTLGDSISDRVSERPYESAVGIFGLMTAFLVGRRFKG